MYEQGIHMHDNLLQVCSIKADCQLHRVSSCVPALQSKLSMAEASDFAPVVALMLFKKASAGVLRWSLRSYLQLVPSLEPCK